MSGSGDGARGPVTVSHAPTAGPVPAQGGGGPASPTAPGSPPPVGFRQRWLSRRALSLHLLVAVVAPGCVAAGWWQATRALSGNGLSWAYSVEWPAFAVVAVIWWWNLVHEDPADYAARKASRHDAAPVSPAVAAGPAAGVAEEVDPRVARASALLAAACGLEFLTGVVAVAVVPFGRPSGWLPTRGAAVYLAHAVLGGLVALAALGLLVRARHAGRRVRVVAWAGLVLLFVAGGGGLATEAASAMRFFGMAVMFVGSTLATFAYFVPPALAARGRSAGDPDDATTDATT